MPLPGAILAFAAAALWWGDSDNLPGATHDPGSLSSPAPSRSEAWLLTRLSLAAHVSRVLAVRQERGMSINPFQPYEL